MNTSTVLTSLLLAGAAVLPPLASAAETCDPRVLQSPTKFPASAQYRGQKGTVLVEVQLDTAGRAQAVKVLESSGYLLLDRAAARSIRSAWRFDVSACVPKEFPANQVVAVEFRQDDAPLPNGTPALARRF